MVADCRLAARLGSAGLPGLVGHSVGFGMALVYLLAALAALLVGTTTVRTLHRFCFKRRDIWSCLATLSR